MNCYGKSETLQDGLFITFYNIWLIIQNCEKAVILFGVSNIFNTGENCIKPLLRPRYMSRYLNINKLKWTDILDVFVVKENKIFQLLSITFSERNRRKFNHRIQKSMNNLQTKLKAVNRINSVHEGYSQQWCAGVEIILPKTTDA